MVVEREKTIRLLREAILQLCRVSLMGSFEVDGIICISLTNTKEEHQLVVKVHEQVSDDSISGQDARDRKRDSQPGRVPALRCNDHDDSMETTNETVSTWKNSGSDANSWTSDFAGCISGNGWKQVDKMLKAPSGRRLLAPSHNHEEIQELSIKKTVRKIEDSFYYSCKWCAIAFTSKLALESHLEQCTTRGANYLYVNPRPLEEVKCTSFQQRISRKRKQRKPLKGLEEAVTSGNRNEIIDSHSRRSRNDVEPSDQFRCSVDQTNNDRAEMEGDPVGLSSNDLQDTLHEVLTESVLNVDRNAIMHMKSEQLYTCQICGVSISDFASSLIHYRTVHGLFACAFCHEKFPDQHILSQHVALHVEMQSYDCLLCGLVFTRRSLLIDHHKQVHGLVMDGSCLEDAGDHGDPFTEDKEEKPVGEEMIFAKPEDFDDREEGNNYFDPVVNHSCSEELHAQNNIPPSEGFSDLHITKEVLRSVGVVSPKLHRSFDGKERLSFGDDDDDDKVYECDKCRELIRGTGIYQMHCKKLHRRTPCLHCGKTFSQKGNMERHMRLHTGIKPYRCHLCRRSFCRKEALLGHISQDHSTALQGTL